MTKYLKNFLKLNYDLCQQYLDPLFSLFVVEDIIQHINKDLSAINLKKIVFL